MMVGRGISYWNNPFLGDMLVFWGVPTIVSTIPLVTFTWNFESGRKVSEIPLCVICHPCVLFNEYGYPVFLTKNNTFRLMLVVVVVAVVVVVVVLVVAPPTLSPLTLINYRQLIVKVFFQDLPEPGSLLPQPLPHRWSLVRGAVPNCDAPICGKWALISINYFTKFIEYVLVHSIQWYSIDIWYHINIWFHLISSTAEKVP